MNSLKEAALKDPYLYDLVYDPMKYKICKLDIEEQAKYADAICEKLANNALFCREQLNCMQNLNNYDDWNSTGVGNVAFMSLYGHESYRMEFLEQLYKFLTYVENSRLSAIGVESV